MIRLATESPVPAQDDRPPKSDRLWPVTLPVSNLSTYVVIFATVFAVALGFALYTNNAWEDYWITFRASKNLATGHGLVYSLGERVHTFTSPLNVLLPALMSFVTGNHSDMLVLWLFRIICGCALGFAAVLLFRIGQRDGLKTLPLVVMLGMFGTDAKIVDFSINGQEPALMMIFLALALFALTVPSHRPSLLLGVAWAGLLWTRPDSFIYFGGLALGFFLFNGADSSVAKSPSDLLKLFLRAGAITTVLYLPWFIWSWSYYGSPVPHTIIAKGLRSPEFDPFTFVFQLVSFPIRSLAQPTSLDLTFVPIHADSGGWGYGTMVYGKYLAWLCAFYWLLPLGRPKARAVSFAFMTGEFYLTHIAAYPFPWYLPSCAIFGIFVFAEVLQQGFNLVSALKGKFLHEKGLRQLDWSIRIGAGAALGFSIILTVGAAYQLRIQQKLVENGNRKQIGLWLAQHGASPKDSVLLEPLGYIGYFSQLKMYDFPGLASPEMVAARRKLGTDDWDKLISELRPDWLVLRPGEAESIHQKDQSILTKMYSQAEVFDVSKQIEAYDWIPGRPYLLYDQTFLVFKRNP